MSKICKELNELNEEILQRVLSIQNTQTQLAKEEEGIEAKLKEFKKLSENLTKLELKESEMCIRNRALREKFNSVDSNVKRDSAAITEEMKTYFKKLGLRVTQTITPDNRIELRLQFTENLQYSVTLFYDTVTEDFDILRMQPEHPRFTEIRQFFRDSQDIQGFLFNYRNRIKSLTTHENHQQNENNK